MFGEILKYLPSNMPNEAFEKAAIHPTDPLKLQRISDLLVNCPFFFLHIYFPTQPKIVDIHPVMIDFAQILVISFARNNTTNQI